jgi:hypothetical protein
MPVLPKMGSSFSPENSRIWFSRHQTLEVYFDQFEFLEWFSDKPTIFSTLEGEKMVMQFPRLYLNILNIFSIFLLFF